MRKPLIMAVVLVALIFVTTACRAEVNIVLDVAEDGSGTVTGEVGMDDELLELVQEFGGEEDLLGQLPEGTDAETRRQEDMTFYSVTQAFETTDDLLAQAGALEGFETTFEQFDLVVEDGGASLDARIETADASEALDGLGVGGLGGFEDLGEDIISSSFIVALPGEVEETNADETLSDGRLRWDVPLLGGTVDIMAVTTAGGGGVPMFLIVGLIALVVIGGVFWLSRRQRRESAAAVSAAPPPPAPSGLFEATDDDDDGTPGSPPD